MTKSDVTGPASGPHPPPEHVRLAVDQALQSLVALSLTATEEHLLSAFNHLATAAEEARAAQLHGAEVRLLDATGHLLQAQLDESRSAVIEAWATALHAA